MGALAQIPDIASGLGAVWERYVRPPHPDQTSPAWHISPVIDMAAYHFSWVWVLGPMLLAARYNLYFYIYIYALVIGATLAHRHFGLPYAYFDGGVFRAFKRQLTWFPLICIALMAATPLLLSGKVGAVGRQTVGAVVLFSVLWNFWHVYMQKFGILRLYLAKDSAPVLRKTPARVDKYFLLCWFPLYFSYLGPTYKDIIFRYGRDVEPSASVIISFMDKYENWLLFPSALVAAGGVSLWLWHEWHAYRFRNRARLSAATGTLLISTALFWADPVIAFIAFGFSHAAEYMVFVWAFQRRRYSRPQLEPSLMQRLLRYPKTWYLCFTTIFAAAGFAQVLWSHPIWLFYYAVYESLIHFHLDGFLWKMRRLEVRENI
jgi:hypothetical protein